MKRNAAQLEEIQRLYLKEHMSTYQLEKLFNKKPGTIKSYLHYKGLLRPALGKDIEDMVYAHFFTRGFMVVKQKGDAPFDLLIDGQRVDVKSASKTPDNGRRYYKFQLQDGREKKAPKDLVKEIDWFYLVFKDLDGMPLFKIASQDVTAKYSLSITDPYTKPSLIFVDLLKGGGETYDKRLERQGD